MKDVDEKIDKESDEIKKGELAREYYRLTKLWKKVDEFIEFTLKHELDCMNMP